jgi:hypothetical protein
MKPHLVSYIPKYYNFEILSRMLVLATRTSVQIKENRHPRTLFENDAGYCTTVQYTVAVDVRGTPALMIIQAHHPITIILECITRTVTYKSISKH